MWSDSLFTDLSWFRNVSSNNLNGKCTRVCKSNVIFCPIYGCAAEVLVLIDFQGSMSDELTVKMGDVVKNVTKASEEGWLMGELDGKRGIFPSNFVKVGNKRHVILHSDSVKTWFIF